MDIGAGLERLSAMVELSDASTTVEMPRLHAGLLVGGTAVIGAIFWLILLNPRGPITLVLIGAITLAAVWKARLLTRQDPIWLGFVLLLCELLSPCAFVPDRVRPIATYGLTLLFCLPAIPILWRIWKGPRSDFKLYLIYFGWCLVTITYAMAPKFALGHLLRSLFMFAGIAMVSLRARQTDNVQRVIRCMMLACIVVTLATAVAAVVLPHSITWGTELQQSGPNADDVDEVDRFQGPFDNPSRLGELALVTVGLILTYFEFAKQRERIFLTVAALMAVGLTALADSRSGLIALAIGGSFYAFWKYRLRGLMVLTVASVLVAGVLIIGGPAIAPYIWRGDVWTLTGRTDIWPFVIHEIVAKPITGYGYQMAGEILTSRFFPVWWGPFGEGVHNSVHNGYLAHMVGVGIPAFIFWLFIMLHPWFSLFRQADDPWRLKRVFFFIVIPVLIVNFDEEMISECLGPSGFLFAMTWALAEQYRLTRIRQKAMAWRRSLQNVPAAVAALRS
jgi:hypothetical protein